MNRTTHFAACTSCGANWSSVEEFILDDSLILLACQASLLSPERSVFLFAHEGKNCGATITVHAGSLKRYATNLDLTAPAAGGPTCNRSCFVQSDLSPCSVNCYMRWVRDLIPLLKNKSLVVRRAG